MARITYVDPDSITDPDLARAIEFARQHGTPRVESQAVRAHVPEILRTFSATWQAAFREGVLDHSTKELARLYIAKSLECGYCGAQRSHQAVADGLAEDKIDELVDFRRSDRFSPRELTALRYAEAIAWDPALADDALWADLHTHFTEPQIVELGYFIGLTMGQQRFIRTLDVRHGDLDTSTDGLARDAAHEVAARESSTRSAESAR